MKIDRSKLKKSSSEVPPDCKALIESLTSSAPNKFEFLKVLQSPKTWNFGKCELIHWIDVLDICDKILEVATSRPPSAPEFADGGSSWAMAVDSGDQTKALVQGVLNFTTHLIHNSSSRQIYSSAEHLTSLLASSDLDVVLSVLNLLFRLVKIPGFTQGFSSKLFARLTNLAASWGGKDNGFCLSKICSDDPVSTFPESATNVHFEFYTENMDDSDRKSTFDKGQPLTVINVEQVII